MFTIIVMKKFSFENAGTERSFAEQFRDREAIETEGGKVETVDINPDAGGTPYMLIPAWACTANVYEPAIENFAEGYKSDEDTMENPNEPKQKARVLMFDAARFGGSAVSSSEEVNKYPEEEIRRANAILGVLDAKGIEKVNAVGHSEGAINLVLAAMVNPEKFESLTLFAPAGLIGKDTFTRLLKGFAGQGTRAESLNGIRSKDGSIVMPEIPVTETRKKVGAVSAKEGALYALKNPYRAMKEGIGISNSQIHEALRYLHEKGVMISVVTGVDDPVFPMKRIQEIVKSDMLDGFLSVRGGHGEIGNHPELYVEAIKSVIHSMEKKKEKLKAAV